MKPGLANSCDCSEEDIFGIQGLFELSSADWMGRLIPSDEIRRCLSQVKGKVENNKIQRPNPTNTHLISVRSHMGSPNLKPSKTATKRAQRNVPTSKLAE
jgi:hypothetical protein